MRGKRALVAQAADPNTEHKLVQDGVMDSVKFVQISVMSPVMFVQVSVTDSQIGGVEPGESRQTVVRSWTRGCRSG